jgi:nitrate reductase gamma subunit
MILFKFGVSVMLPNSQQKMSPEDQICQERIRQAKLAFNLSVAFVGTSAVIAIIGIVFLLAGRISQGAYAAIGGLASTAVGSRCVQLSREANDRLDRLTRESDDEDKIQ